MAATVYTLATLVATLCLVNLTCAKPLEGGASCWGNPLMMKVCGFCDYIYPNKSVQRKCCEGEPELTGWCKTLYVEPMGRNGYIA